MKKLLSALLALIFIFSLPSCGKAPEGAHMGFNSASMAAPAHTKPELPKHSPFYIPDIPVEDVILYFNEVALDSEIINGGDPSVVQKWVSPVYYTLDGEYTDEDIAVLESFTAWLNTVEGFPGIFETDDAFMANLRIFFVGSEDEMTAIMGPDYYGMDGAVTFWYMDNEIYDATICYRTDIPQYTRNSVIIEEIYNGLGPVQDTSLREDSIIYSGFSEPQQLSSVDELIIRLLYCPDIKVGMHADECAQIIRALYY